MRLVTSVLFLLLLIGAVLIASVLLESAAQPRVRSVLVSKAATLLFYNNPAAVVRGDDFYVGYGTNAGHVEVARLSKQGELIEVVPIVELAPSDHIAPALWPTSDGVLVAASFHSGNASLYALKGNVPELLCLWEGRYTYPRFDEVDGRLRLYFRQATEGRGDLVSVDVGADCGEPQIVVRAPDNEIIYAAAPHDGRLAWSVYRPRVDDQITGLYVDGLQVDVDTGGYPNTRAWSIVGEYLSVTHGHNTRCCGIEAGWMTLFRAGELIYEETAPAPRYPPGIVIAADASEVLVPTGTTLLRRRLPDLKVMPSCETGPGFNWQAQYIRGGGGAYVWTSFLDTVDLRSYPQAEVWLCLTP